MLSVSIGPLAFPVAPLVILASIWIGATIAGRMAAKPDAARAESTVWLAAIIGLISARVGFLIMHRDAYLQFPWSALDIRDGGWLAWPGFLVAGLWLTLRVARLPLVRRAVMSGAMAIVAIWSAANLAIWYSQDTGTQQAVPSVPVNRLADGEQRMLAKVLAGKPAVVNLWATWCGPCRVEMPALAQAQDRYRDIQFVFVNQGESAQVIRAYLATENLVLRQVWLDGSRALGSQVGSGGLPTTLFFNAQGRQVDAHFGVLSAASIAAKVSQLRQAEGR